MPELYKSKNERISNGVNEEKLLNINKAAEYLEISSEELRRLVDKGAISAYHIGGVFLRFKKSHLEAVKQSARRMKGNFNAHQPCLPSQGDYSFCEKLKDFFYFNDFYIISIIVILIILAIIFI